MLRGQCRAEKKKRCSTKNLALLPQHPMLAAWFLCPFSGRAQLTMLLEHSTAPRLHARLEQSMCCNQVRRVARALARGAPFRSVILTGVTCAQFPVS